MESNLKKLSKFLSFVLRHDPGAVGLTLDSQGWVSVEELLSAARKGGTRLDRPTLERVVRENDKQRFALSEDGTRIRANQGHSVEVELEYQPATPPETLYHGTVDRFLESIRAQGLQRGARHHVHLSADIETASAVGQRRGKPVVLEINAAAMHEAQHAFYCTPNGVWLTQHVPPEFLRFP